MDDREWAVSKRRDWAQKESTSTYETKMGWHARRVDTEVYGEYLKGESGRVLDLPCGTGRFLRQLETDQDQRFRPVGADYSLSMMTVAQSTAASPLVRCDGFFLPFQPETFDVVLCTRLVFHYHAPHGLFDNFRRVLRPGGLLAFDSLNRWSLRHILAGSFDLFRPKHGKQLWFASFEEMHDLLADSGFQVEQRTSRFMLPTRAYRFLPRFLIRFLASVEPVVPDSRRVLSYWKARKV